MAEDAMILDQAMDIDSNVPSAPPSNTIPGTSANRSPLRARRNISNPKELRPRPRDRLRADPSAKIHKSSSSTPKTVLSLKVHTTTTTATQDRDSAIRRAHRIKMHQVHRAIADGTFKIDDPSVFTLMASGAAAAAAAATVTAHQGVPMHVRRLDAQLVAAALFDPVPGMTFDPAAACAFTGGDQAAVVAMADLVQALESFQVHLARKGRVVLSEKAPGLLRGLARDVLLAALLSAADRLPGAALDDGEEFWARVARDYVERKRVKWLALRLMEGLDPRERSRESTVRRYMMAVRRFLEDPSETPDWAKFLAQAIKEMPPFIVAQPSTLRALVGHFETARARYLANLKTAAPNGTPPSGTPSFHPKPAAPDFGKLLRGGDGRYDSSEDEDENENDDPRGGAEDAGQVEDAVPSDQTQWFLVKLDGWAALKNGEQQGAGVDADMLSALNLGGVKSNL